jgi:hypothetical protein
MPPKQREKDEDATFFLAIGCGRCVSLHSKSSEGLVEPLVERVHTAENRWQ